MPFAYIEVPNTKSGRKTVTAAGTAVALATSNTRCKLLTIMGMEQNTDKVVVGGSDVVAGSSADAGATRKGIPLSPGQAITIVANDLKDLYIDSVVSGEGVTFIYQY